MIVALRMTLNEANRLSEQLAANPSSIAREVVTALAGAIANTGVSLVTTHTRRARIEDK